MQEMRILEGRNKECVEGNEETKKKRKTLEGRNQNLEGNRKNQYQEEGRKNKGR
jgi:hypothetical protein